MRINPIAYIFYRLDQWLASMPRGQDDGFGAFVVLTMMISFYGVSIITIIEIIMGKDILGDALLPFDMPGFALALILLPFVYGTWCIISRLIDYDGLMKYYAQESARDRAKQTWWVRAFCIGSYVLFFGTGIVRSIINDAWT